MVCQIRRDTKCFSKLVFETSPPPQAVMLSLRSIWRGAHTDCCGMPTLAGPWGLGSLTTTRSQKIADRRSASGGFTPCHFSPIRSSN